VCVFYSMCPFIILESNSPPCELPVVLCVLPSLERTRAGGILEMRAQSHHNHNATQGRNPGVFRLHQGRLVFRRGVKCTIPPHEARRRQDQRDGLVCVVHQWHRSSVDLDRPQTSSGGRITIFEPERRTLCTLQAPWVKVGPCHPRSVLGMRFGG